MTHRKWCDEQDGHMGTCINYVYASPMDRTGVITAVTVEEPNVGVPVVVVQQTGQNGSEGRLVLPYTAAEDIRGALDRALGLGAFRADRKAA